LEELSGKSDADPLIWSSSHSATLNLKDMTAVIVTIPSETLNLIRGETYSRPRGDDTFTANLFSCDLKAKWPTVINEYGILWKKTIKGDENAEPSIREVVMGVYKYLFESVGMSIEESDPYKLK